MKFFLLSCLAYSATAFTPKEQLQTAFDHLLGGDHVAYAELFADGMVMSVDFGKVDWSVQGVQTISADNPVSNFLAQFAKVTVYDVKYEIYNNADPTKGHYNGHFILKDESNQRWSLKYICNFEINDEGKLTSATHYVTSETKKIDAGSISTRLIEGFKKGDVSALSDNLAPEFCMTAITGPTHESYAGGKHCGLSGLHDVLAAQGAAFKEFTIGKYQLENLANDGRTAIFSLSAFITFHDERQVEDLYLLSYHVNDLGQFTGHEGTTVSSFEVRPAKSDKEL